MLTESFKPSRTGITIFKYCITSSIYGSYEQVSWEGAAKG